MLPFKTYPFSSHQEGWDKSSDSYVCVCVYFISLSLQMSVSQSVKSVRGRQGSSGNSEALHVLFSAVVIVMVGIYVSHSTVV